MKTQQEDGPLDQKLSERQPLVNREMTKTLVDDRGKHVRPASTTSFRGAA